MVIVRLKGGLGNQMFQYAAARRMALAHNVPLKLDISWFALWPDRAYALHALGIQEAFATPNELRQITGPPAKGVARVLFRLRRRFGIADAGETGPSRPPSREDRKSTRLNSSHLVNSYAGFCLKKKK